MDQILWTEVSPFLLLAWERHPEGTEREEPHCMDSTVKGQLLSSGGHKWKSAFMFPGGSHQIQEVRKFIPRHGSGLRAGVSPSQKYTSYPLPAFNRVQRTLIYLPVFYMHVQCSCLWFCIWLCSEFIATQENCFMLHKGFKYVFSF